MRPGTSARGYGGGIGAMDRPITQQGVGIPKTSAGGGRAVQDRSFWIGEIKFRLNMVNAELSKIENDKVALEAENANSVNLEKRSMALSDELRNLQGQLGDYNTLIDKWHTNTNLDELARQGRELRAANDSTQSKVDSLFTERQDKENRIKEIEVEIAAEKQMAAKRVAELGPDAASKWTSLEADSDQILSQIGKLQEVLTAQQSRQAQLKVELQAMPDKQKIWNLQTKQRTAEEKLKSLQAEEQGIGQLQTKDQILEEVKKNNAEIASMERNLAELKKTRQQLEEYLSRLDSNISDEKAAKFDELRKKEKEMAEFFDQFDALMAAETEKMGQFQNTIVGHLAQIQALGSTSIVSQLDFKRMRGDLKEKEKELSAAEETVLHVNSERDRLVGDLERVNQLEEKITLELESIRTRQEEMKADLVRFDNVAAIKSNLDAQLASVKAMVADLKEQRKWTKTALTAQTTRYDAKKGQLQDNDTHRQLTALENKWTQHEAANQAMRDSIADKRAQTDFTALKQSVLAAVDKALDQNMKMAAQAL